jgi:GNAT superfamily N-acetyltransferase
MISYTFEPDHEPQNSHLLDVYIIDRVSAWADGKRIGYLKIAHVASSRLKNIKSIWHYQSYFQGWCVGLHKLKNEPEDRPVDYGSLWRGVHLYAKANPASSHKNYWCLEAKDTPDRKTIEADLRIVARKYLPDLKRFIRERANFAYVDYIHVDDEFRRQGIGTQLYVLGAMWLATHRKIALHGSSLQSDSAKAVWADMIASGKYPISQVEKKYYQGIGADPKLYLYKKLDYYSDLRWRNKAYQVIKKLQSLTSADCGVYSS